MSVLESLSSISDLIFSWLGQIWKLYAAGTVLLFPIVLWMLDRLFGIFDDLNKH